MKLLFKGVWGCFPSKQFLRIRPSGGFAKISKPVQVYTAFHFVTFPQIAHKFTCRGRPTFRTPSAFWLVLLFFGKQCKVVPLCRFAKITLRSKFANCLLGKRPSPLEHHLAVLAAQSFWLLFLHWQRTFYKRPMAKLKERYLPNFPASCRINVKLNLLIF